MNAIKYLVSGQTTIAKTVRVAVYFVCAVAVASLQDPNIYKLVTEWFPSFAPKIGGILTVIVFLKNTLDPTVKNK
jgi:hypothetical protein